MPKPDLLAQSQEYANLVNLLALYSEVSNQMLAMQADMQAKYMELIDEAKPEYATLQEKLGQAEAALELLALAHPEWFPADCKSIQTPYGKVKFTSTSALVISNEEASILLIQNLGGDAEEKYLRTNLEINREALEQLSEAELKALRIKRVKDQSFKVTPASLDMGKAVKAADKAKGKGAKKGAA